MKKRYLFGIVALIMGFLFLLLGVFTFMNPDIALTTFVYVYGFAAIIGGILGVIYYATLEHRTGFGPVSSLICGILNILLGVLLVSNIWAGRFALTVIFPFWFIFLCISRLCNLGYIRRYAGNGEYWLTLIVNVLGLLLGFVLLISPLASLLTLTYLVGFYLIMAGMEMIVFAFGHFKHKDFPTS